MSAHADKRGLARLMLQWPRARRHLAAQYDADSELRSLCAAYEEAYAALEMRRRRAADTAAEMSDYDQLIGELETDICARLAPEIDGFLPDRSPTALGSLWQRVRRAFST